MYTSVLELKRECTRAIFLPTSVNCSDPSYEPALVTNPQEQEQIQNEQDYHKDNNMELTVQAPTTPVKSISPRPQRDRKNPRENEGLCVILTEVYDFYELYSFIIMLLLLLCYLSDSLIIMLLCCYVI